MIQPSYEEVTGITATTLVLALIISPWTRVVAVERRKQNVFRIHSGDTISRFC